MLGVPTTANARPAGYGSAACNPGGTDVCAYDSVHDSWKCDTANITTGTSAATAWMIHGEIDAASTDCGNVCDGNPYCSFGVRNGVKYYCDLDEGAGAGSTIVEGWLIGTPGADWLSFWYEEGTISCVMENAGLDVTKVTGKILGGSADDDIFGSTQSNDSTYQDSLSGDSGKDTIMSFAGSDIIHGGSGNDDINSGTGDDVIFGEDDADNISSGEDDDVVYGGPGVDQICTDGGNYDVAYGGDDGDQIWDDDGSDDSAYGGDNLFDMCESDNEYGCELPLLAKPASCPAEVTPYH